MIHTLLRTRKSARLSRSWARGSFREVPGAALSKATRSRWSRIPASLVWSAFEQLAHQLLTNQRWQTAAAARVHIHLAYPGSGACPDRTRRYLQTRSSTRLGRGLLDSSPRGSGQVAAVDRRAAGGIGDHDAVAEQLAEQLDIRGLAAAGAGPGELKQGLQQLRILDRFGC